MYFIFFPLSFASFAILFDTEDEHDLLKLTNVVRLRPNDLPDRSKESGSFALGLFSGKHLLSLTTNIIFLLENGA